MEGLVVLVIGGLLLGIVLGAFLGFLAFGRSGRLQTRVAKLEAVVKRHHEDLRQLKTGGPEASPAPIPVRTAERPPVEAEHPEAVQGPAAPTEGETGPEIVQGPSLPKRVASTPAEGTPPSLRPISAPPPPPEREAAVAARDTKRGEFELGSRWIAYAAIVMLLIGAGLFMKYAIDNDWIGPRGRIAIGCLAGLGALGLGEFYRRKNFLPLFQTLTGGGIAVFYLCIYFAVQVYHLADPGAGFVLAILVTGLGVTMAVAHNALSIACLAVIGGFLSPIMVSTGGDHPYVLFTYIAILDLTAMGAALYRRWPALDFLCFVGTLLLYQAWYNETDADASRKPALLYAGVFYLLFLLTPILYGLYRKASQRIDGLALVIINSVYTTLVYWNILFEESRLGLGYVLLAQGLVTFALFQVWSRRVLGDNTAHSLLTLSLALITLVIPVILRGDAIPIAWAIEGALLVQLGLRFGSVLTRLFGFAAGCFSVLAFLSRLPAHELPSMIFFNSTFGTGAFVVAGLVLSGRSLLRSGSAEGNTSPSKPADLGLGVLLASAGYVMTTFLLSIEVINYWQGVESETKNVSLFTSLIVLWSVIAAATVTVISRRGWPRIAHLATAYAYLIASIALLPGFDQYGDTGQWPFLSVVFLTRAFFVLTLFHAARVFRRDSVGMAANVFEGFAQFVIAVLVTAEMERWSDVNESISRNFSLACVSALWAVQAFVLIWWGLASRMLVRRVFGLVLFAVTVGKVVFIDVQELSRGFQILTFMASGVLLLLAALFYQRFSAVFLGDDDEGTAHE